MQGDAETILGPYVIEREIGRGGMGVIYKGRDERLGRAVAIKSLPEHFADDPGRLARFELEARALAQLNHPNIAGIYGVENLDGRKYLVLEFVEGETLSERLDAGPIPVDDAIDIADAIAAGIEAAHEAGVVHRDLKPDNIKITPDGKVKILDFGLAKSTKLSTATGFDHESPTLTTPRSPTIPGAILGTAPYMSPEQARGKIVDKRTDIWSFGVVLYEMLTGMRPFDGETATDAIAAILHKDIDFDRLPSNTPIGVRRALKRCLERNRDLRMRDIGDVRLELRDRGDAPTQLHQKHRPAVLWGLIALLILSLGTITALVARERMRVLEQPAPAQQVNLDLALPWPLEQIVHFTLSSDGKTFAFLVKQDNESSPASTIFLRSLDNTQFRELYSTSLDAQMIWFAPDDRDLVVWSADEGQRIHLLRVSVETGAEVRLLVTDPAAFETGSEGCWLTDREFLVISQEYELLAISIDDGSRRKIMDIPRDLGITMWDCTLTPDRKHGLFTVQRGRDIFPRIVAIDLENKNIKELVPDEFWCRIIEPDILISRDLSTLYARRFDPVTCEVKGRKTAVLTDVGISVLSTRGHLAYLPARGQNNRIATIHRDGTIDPLIDAEADYVELVTISPDGRLIAFSKAEGSSEHYALTVNDITMHTSRRVDAGKCFFPKWLPDGRLCYWRQRDDSKPEFMLWDPADSATVAPIHKDLNPYYDWCSFSSDGRYILYTWAASLEEPETCDIYLADLNDPDAAPRPYISTENYEGEAAVSPDGKWLAYTGERDGVTHVFLMPFNPDAPAQTIQVSVDPAMSSFWSFDATKLFFLARPTGDLMEVAIDPTSPTLVTKPVRIAGGNQIDQGYVTAMPDSNYFLFIDRPDRAQGCKIVLNWTEQLKRDLK